MPFDVNKKTKIQAQNIRQFDVLGKKRKVGKGLSKLKSCPAYKKMQVQAMLSNYLLAKQ